MPASDPILDLIEDAARNPVDRPDWDHNTDENGVAVDPDGADDTIVILWASGYTTADTIRELCTRFANEAPYAALGDQPDEIVRAYHRGGAKYDRLVEATLTYHNDTSRNTARVLVDGRVVATGSYPV